MSVCVRVFVCVSVYLYLCVCKSQNLKGDYKGDREILRVDREGNGISMRRKCTAALTGGERERVRQGRGGRGEEGTGMKTRWRNMFLCVLA